MKYERYLQPVINKICFNANKMAFVSGPRQCGKTTMAKLLLQQRKVGVYYNWDETKFRRLWIKDPQLILPSRSSGIKPLIILDELHKAKLWKRSLKGLYDTQDGVYDILVTGSARLNTYRKGSDSLMGRYYHFKLHPFSIAELVKNHHFYTPEDLVLTLFGNPKPISSATEHTLKKLYQFGPFQSHYLLPIKKH